MKMDDDDLKESLALRLEESFEYIFPFIPKNLLKSINSSIQPARFLNISSWPSSISWESINEHPIDSKPSMKFIYNSSKT